MATGSQSGGMFLFFLSLLHLTASSSPSSPSLLPPLPPLPYYSAEMDLLPAFENSLWGITLDKLK